MKADPSSVTDERTVDEIVNEVERFRILVIGRSGVGKSSLINSVFGIDDARIAHLKVGEADIEQEHVSPQNPHFVSHDSKGFEPGELENFEVVRKFVEERSKKPDLKDRIHALWLCVETPAAGGRVFETGDEELLKFAQENELPLVLVFTQYDRLVRTNIFRLRDKDPDMDKDICRRKSVKEAKATFETFLRSLKELPIEKFINVSVRKDFQDVSPVSSLVEATTTVAKDRVRGDAWVLWAIAQRKSFPSKIEASIAKGISYHVRILVTSQFAGEQSIGAYLEKLHKDIITCWGFKGEILNDPGFQGLILQIAKSVDDVDTDGRAVNPTDIFDHVMKLAANFPALPVAAAGVAGMGLQWLRKSLKTNLSQARRLLIAYTVNLINVLIELFDKTIKNEFTATWPELKSALDIYLSSSSCQSIHERIRSEKRGIVTTAGTIRREIDQLVGKYRLERNVSDS